MNKEFIKSALQYASEKLGINYNKLNEYIQLYSSDRRYKIFSCSSTCSWNFNQSGIVKYKGIKYYYNQLGENNIEIEVMR